jgi:hypothetical protein
MPEDRQVVELEDEQLKITATVVDSAMLEWWLRGFGMQFPMHGANLPPRRRRGNRKIDEKMLVQQSCRRGS